MSRPPFEVADIIRISGDSFRQRYSASLTWPQRKVLDAILAAVPLLSAAIATPAPTADIRPSRTTPAVIDIAPSARPVRAISGFASGSRSCCPSTTTTWSSAFHMRLCR